jgi:hypothetical protein
MRQTIAALVDLSEAEMPAGADAIDRFAIAKSPCSRRQNAADNHLAKRAVTDARLWCSHRFLPDFFLLLTGR